MTYSRKAVLLVIGLMILVATACGQVSFSTIDFPGAASTIAYGINTAGDVVGAYALTQGGPWHGFKLSSGSFTNLDYPGAQQTLATGINDNGLIVGFYLTGQGYQARAFTYDGATFTSVQHGTQVITEAWGVNGSGQIVGEAGNSQRQQAFELTNGKFVLIEPPGKSGYYYAFATGINTAGTVVGFVVEYTSNGKGFLYGGGTYKYVTYPGASSTELNGINDNGLMVGYYAYDNSAFYGFAFQSGKFLSMQYPGAGYTICFGVNSSGRIVGEAVVGSSTHGFVTTAIKANMFQVQ